MKVHIRSLFFLIFVCGFGIEASAQTSTDQAGGPAAGGSSATAGTPSEEATDTQEVVVTTSRFREENAQQVGASIRALGSKEIEQAGLVDFQDIARHTPGIQLQDRGPNQNETAIRGISKPTGASTTDIFTAHGVVTYFLDDILVSTMSGNDRDFNLFDLSRVEVLRGPQPTYFGEGSVGGTIRYFTRDPSLSGVNPIQGTLNAGVSSTKGGGTNTKLQGAVDMTLSPDVLGIRISGYTRKDEGFIDNTLLGRNNVNDLKSDGGRITLLAKPTDRLSVRFFANTARDKTGAPWEIQPGSNPQDLVVASPVTGKATDDYDLYGLKLDYKMDTVTFTSITGSYNRERRSNFYDPNFSIATLLYFGTGAYPGFTNPTTTTQLGFKDDNFTQEFRFATNFSGNLNFTGGLFFKRGKFTSVVQAIAPGIAPFTATGTQILTGGTTKFKNDQTSGFLEGTWKATDRLRVIGGARYLDEKLTASFDPNGTATFPSAFLPPGTPAPTTVNSTVLAFAGLGTDFDFSLKKTLPRVAIEYDVSDKVLAYAGASKGVRNGNINPVVSAIGASTSGFVFNPAVFQQKIRYGEDSVTSYEAGLKTLSMDDRLKLNIGVFSIDWKDIQTVVGSPLLLTTNAGSARSDGMEIETSWKVNKNISLFLDGSYTDAQFKTTVNTGAGGIIADGNRLPGVPKYTINVGTDLSYPVGNNLLTTGRIEYQYIGDRYSSPVNMPASKISSLGLLNFRAGLTDGKWTVNGFVNNATNQIKVQSSNVVGGVAIQQFINRPRTIGVELTESF